MGINILSMYLKSMCTEAKINMDGRRFTNHSGKVTCATRLFQTGTFDEQTIMSTELVTAAQLSAPTNGQAAVW